MAALTQFRHPAAVEAWDTWFRWRDSSGLHDRTIDSTWSRVADSIAHAEGASAATWSRRFVQAFSRWHLLPDERLLRDAGTGIGINCDHHPLSAAVNAAAFVVSPPSNNAQLDVDGLTEAASLAVRLLEDARAGQTGSGELSRVVRVGLIGLAEAFERLGTPYGTPAAVGCGRTVAMALATGTLRATVELARERGPVGCDLRRMLTLWRQRDMPEALIEEALTSGVRHTSMTAIGPHPKLAMLANNTSDAIDRDLLEQRAKSYGSRHSGRSTDPSGSLAYLVEQIDLRAAMQPWIDASIDYPILLRIKPEEWVLEVAKRLIEQRGMAPIQVCSINAPSLSSSGAPR